MRRAANSGVAAALADEPATTIGERIGWNRSIRTLSTRVAQLRPFHLPQDLASRTAYEPGAVGQWDFWFPHVQVPVSAQDLFTGLVGDVPVEDGGALGDQRDSDVVGAAAAGDVVHGAQQSDHILRDPLRAYRSASSTIGCIGSRLSRYRVSGQSVMNRRPADSDG